MRKVTCLFLALVCIAFFGNVLFAKTSRNPFMYLSPRPDARFVPPQSTLIFRAGDGLMRAGNSWTSSVQVRGERSGIHDGSWITADDSRTVIFKPYRSFELGEVVTVSVNAEIADRAAIQRDNYYHQFVITQRVVPYEPDYEEQLALDRGESTDLDVEIASRPILSKKDHDDLVLPVDFPNINITVCDDPADGYLFIGTNTTRWGAEPFGYLLILENDGFPVFFRRMPYGVFDFKKQPNGMLSYLMNHTQHFFLLDDTYTKVDSFTSQNGYPIDLHEFQVFPNGHVILIADDPRIIDMSQYVEGGDTAALVVGNVIQEMDQSKNLVFEWRAFDHLDFLDSNFNLTMRRIRYCHINAIELDHDGNILISSRHLSEITKIDRQTGEIIWRFGGKNNEFTLVNDTVWFSRQHDIRRLSNGNISLYDNGNQNKPAESRAVEYMLDEENKIATLVWQYRNDPRIYGSAMGNAQRLPNGNTIIGWGATKPNATEVRMDGTKAFELYLPWGSNLYRAFRFPWEGMASEPHLWAGDVNAVQQLTLHFTKFGDDGVERYYVYRGSSPAPIKKVAVTTGHSVDIHNFTAGETIYFRVTTAGRDNIESPYSNELKITPNFSDIRPLISADLNISPSALNVSSAGRWITAQIEFSGESGYGAADVDVSSIMLNDTILLDPHGSGQGEDVKGNKKKLTVKFPREDVIGILPAAGGALIKVSGIVGEHSFECFDSIKVIRPDDLDARAEPTGSDRVETVDIRSYPNPFNPTTVISFTLPGPMPVNLSIYDVRGRLVATLVNAVMSEGAQQVRWDGRNAHGIPVTSGVYFYRLDAGNTRFTRKIVLLR